MKYIKEYNNFINESFTKTIRSVYNFLKEVGNIDDVEAFKDDLLQFCLYNDIPLSKLSGEYLSVKNALIKADKNPNEDIGIFLFDLKNYISYTEIKIDDKLDKNDFQFKNADFAIIVFINNQPRGLRLLKRQRIDRQEDSNLNKTNLDYKRDNIKRYKDILNKKRLPQTIDIIIKTLMQNNELSDIPKQIKRLKGIIPKDLYSELINRLYDLKVIDENDYFKLSKSYSKSFIITYNSHVGY